MDVTPNTASKGAGGSDAFQNVTIGGQEFQSAVDNLVARAGGGQPLATPITAMYARFTTVGTAGDSGLLPPSVKGMEITVTNAAGNSMNVFPSSGEQVNALGANAAFALAAGKTATFFVATAGQWHALLGA